MLAHPATHKQEEKQMPELASSLGHQYYRRTVLDREEFLIPRPRPNIRPAPARPRKPGPADDLFALPAPKLESATDLWRVMGQRRSVRRYSQQPLSQEELAILLWAAQGVTARCGRLGLRTAPSAGALYPIETYLAAERVTDLAPGLYHFQVEEFALARRAYGSHAASLAAAAIHQDFVARAAVVFCWSAVFRRNMSKYGDRGMRYICMDVGHICQNLLLAATALGRSACPVAAFFDDELSALFGLDGTEEGMLYLAAVG